jgi:hypothetical protein
MYVISLIYVFLTYVALCYTVLPYMYMLFKCTVYTSYFILDYIFYVNFSNEFIAKFEISYYILQFYVKTTAISRAETYSCYIVKICVVLTDYLLVLFVCKLYRTTMVLRNCNKEELL